MATRKRSQRPKRQIRWGRLFLLSVVVLLLLVGGVGIGYTATVLRDIPNITDFQYRPAQTSFIYDRDGNLVTAIPSPENRILVQVDEIPDQVKDAFVAIEDQRFEQHIGVDVLGIARAAWVDLRTGTTEQGASTITQQLVRNTVESIGMEQTLSRKIKEAFLALALERRYTKDEILEMYLNQINLGHNARGVEAAARLYFGRADENKLAVQQLTLAQAALLAALPKAPNTYSPYNNPDLAVERRNLVLDKMAQLGYAGIEEVAAAKEEPLELKGPNQETSYPYPYFVDFVLANLLQEFDPELVRGGGLKVYTTLNPQAQKAAEEAIAALMDERYPFDAEAGPNSAPQAAMVILDQQTGHLQAIVGGRQHTQVLGLNRAWHAPWDETNAGLRQPGSAIKPLSVYSTALSLGYTAATVVDDTPKIWSTPGAPSHVITNYDGMSRGYFGLTTMREGLRRSINTVSAAFVELVGVDQAYENARRLGLSTLTDMDKNISPMSVGGLTRGVSVMDMAKAYATIANGGTRIEPVAILRVENPAGEVIYQATPQRTTVLDPKMAYVMTDILRTNVTQDAGPYNLNFNTGAAAQIPGWAVAGKTGTTDDASDVWFAGYTPVYTGVVWVGFDQPQSMTSLGISSSNTPAPIWQQAMSQTLEGMEPQQFARPSGIVTRDVSIKSGKLPGPNTPPQFIRSEIFVRGTEPTEIDDSFINLPVVEAADGKVYKWNPTCGGSPVEKTFLNRPRVTAEDLIPVAEVKGFSNPAAAAAQMVPQDMKLAPPIEECSAYGPGSGFGSPGGTWNGEVYEQSVTLRRYRFDPLYFRVPAGTTIRLTITVTDDETHEVVVESDKVEPDSQSVRIDGGETEELVFQVTEEGLVTVRDRLHPQEQLRIIISEPVEEPPAEDEPDASEPGGSEDEPAAGEPADEGESDEAPPPDPTDADPTGFPPIGGIGDLLGD